MESGSIKKICKKRMTIPVTEKCRIPTSEKKRSVILTPKIENGEKKRNKNVVAKKPMTSSRHKRTTGPILPCFRNRNIDNPWIYENDVIKRPRSCIRSLSIIGKLERVPTVSNEKYRILTEPKFSENKKKKMIDMSIKIDPIIKTPFYFKNKNADPKEQKIVSKKMRKISENIINMSYDYINELLVVPFDVTEVKDINNFNKMLELYENNQNFYAEKLENHDITKEELSKELTILEEWFCNIVEPKPKNSYDVDDWKYREQFKIENGFSVFSDENLREFIHPLKKELLDNIKNKQLKKRIWPSPKRRTPVKKQNLKQ